MQRTGRIAALRRAAAVLGVLGWLIGCDIQPPDGAYDAANYDVDSGVVRAPDLDSGGAVEVEASIPIGGGAGGSVGGSPGAMAGGTAGGMAGGTPGGMAGGQAGGTQGGTAGGTEGGAGGTTGGMADPELARLEKLAGHYYMRMDMLSTATANAPLIGAVRTTNLTSHLLVTQLYLQDGKLTAAERLCYQTFAHRCDDGCRRLATTMRLEVKNELVLLQSTRTYQVSPGGLSLRGDPQNMYLGFNAMGDAALPTSTSDPRVWQNGTGNSAREGMWLYLDTQSESGITSLACDVYTVQKFVSAFDGTLKGTAQMPSLEGVSATLDTAGSDGTTLGASDRNCADTGAAPDSIPGAQTVRFARANVVTGQASETDFWGCAAAPSVWDELLAPPPL